MNRLNADGHDESQYLPRKWLNPKTGKQEDFPIVNSFREKKGDIVQLEEDGGVNRVITWLPKILSIRKDEYGNPYISGDIFHTCECIERIFMSTMVALGVSDLRNYICSGESDNFQGKEVDKFKALLSGLLPYQSNLCLWFVIEDYNRGNIQLALKIISSIVSSLRQAQKILDDLNRSDNI